MALSTGSGFSKLARMDSQIQAVLATLVEEPTPKHQPFVSKKKEAKRKREEQERALELLRSTPLDQLEFAPPVLDQTTQAASAQSELEELEQQMRSALGIDTAPPVVVAKPVPVAKVEPKADPDTLFIKPKVAKPRTEMHIVKRRIEVLLRIARPDGLELPFFHEETQGSEFEAELAAGRKARGYGFKVLATIKVTLQEQAYDRWA